MYFFGCLHAPGEYRYNRKGKARIGRANRTSAPGSIARSAKDAVIGEGTGKENHADPHTRPPKGGCIFYLAGRY